MMELRSTEGKTLLDLHVHSRFSYDSPSRPKDIVKHAKLKGLSGVAVTDHNTVKGGVEARRFSGEDFLVIVGAEYATAIGHILGLFLTDEILPTSSTETIIEEIHRQGGLAILAHPSKRPREISPQILESLDGIEAFNSRAEGTSRCSPKAASLPQLFGQSRTAGSDAHFLFELGRATLALETNLDEAQIRSRITNGEGEVSGRPTGPWAEGLSQMVKSMKRRSPRVALKATAKMLWYFLFELHRPVQNRRNNGMVESWNIGAKREKRELDCQRFL